MAQLHHPDTDSAALAAIGAPGPTAARATTRAMERDPLRFLAAMASYYGDVVRLPMTFGTTYLINSPDGLRHVLQDQAANYGKEPHENAIFMRFVGESVLTTEGDTWRRLRRLEQAMFHRQQIAATSTPMVATIQAFLDGWRAPATQADTIDMVPAMTTLAIQVLGKSIFSLDLGDDTQTIAAALKVIGAYALKLFYQPFLPHFGPLAAINRRGQAAQQALEAVVLRLISTRRTQITAHATAGGAAPPQDILTLFLQLSDDDGKPAFTDDQIRNETLSLLIAGHENVASLLCWTWYLLAQHPTAATRIAAEVTQVLGDRVPTVADVTHLVYTQMVIEEAMRLYPPAWSFSRRALRDDVIGGYTIPAGATILLSPYTTQRNPALWPDPERFDPERFTAAARADRPRYAYFPFGGGQHQCMGAAFAMIEAPLIVAMIAQRYRLELPHDTMVQPEPLVTLRPRTLPMTLRPIS